jgi:hypothetical protein
VKQFVRLSSIALSSILLLALSFAFSSSPASAATSTICTGSPVPFGWIVTNDSWDPTRCGNPPTISYNVQTITSHYDQPLGTTLTVCTYAPVPPGWTVTSMRWDPGSCGHPSFISNNISTIQRTFIGTPVINTNGVVNGIDFSPNDIHPGTTVAIFGINFNSPDLVIVTQGSNQYVIQSGSVAWFDSPAQINATLPGTLSPGFATVFVQNTSGFLSSGQTITILP